MEAHAEDLRDEVHDETMVAAVKEDFRRANLEPATRALLEMAVKLTREPARMAQDDVASLRREGFSDRAILDAVEIVAYFNYINRVADGLHVDLEPSMGPRP